jgi:hypothetical protein
VIASRGSWLALSFAKSVGDGAHEPRGTAPVSPLYVFGRTQDISLQKARNNISLPEPTIVQFGAAHKTFRRIGAEAVILAALTRAIAIDFVLLKPRSLGVCQSKKSSLLSNGDFVSRRVG